MFTKMRRSDREMPVEETWEVLAGAQYGILSTIGANGYPYGVPISFTVMESKIYFHCAANVGSKVENIRFNPKVCFTVVCDTEVLPEMFSTRYRSAVAFGTAREVFGETKQAALEAVVDKYSSAFKEKGLAKIAAQFEQINIFEINVDHITGKARR